MFGPILVARPRVCPFEDIKDCPLYVASHSPHGIGCAGGDLMECDVTKGRMNYETSMRRLTKFDA
jgi:hypothetical protein